MVVHEASIAASESADWHSEIALSSIETTSPLLERESTARLFKRFAFVIESICSETVSMANRYPVIFVRTIQITMPAYFAMPYPNQMSPIAGPCERTLDPDQLVLSYRKYLVLR